MSVQTGAGIANRLFSQLPPASVTTLRLWTAALVMLIVAGRPAARAVADLKRRGAWPDAVIATAFGVDLGFMNFAIYQAFARIPLGIAVTIEFLGPLTVTVTGALAGRADRRAAARLALGCAALAAIGVVLLAQQRGRPPELGRRRLGGRRLAPPGRATSSAARATGQRMPGSSGLVVAMCVAAVVVTIPGVVAGGGRMFRPQFLAVGAAIGILSSVIPYWLELEALRRISAQLFGVWMSLQPAVAALIGLALLSQRLSLAEWLGIGCVVTASAAASRRPAAPPPTIEAGPEAIDGASAPAAGDAAEAARARACRTECVCPGGAVNGALRMVRVFSRLIAPVLRPTVRALHGWALAAMISNAVVIATGAAVRLSSSGLGCPDWPNCTKSSDFASHSSGQTLLNSWIEFGNRLLNFPLVAIAGLTFIAFFCWHRQQRAAGRPGRKDLVWLSAVLPLGVVAQAVVGGIVVLTKLNPALVSVHFLLSTAIILTAAVVLHARTVALEKADAQPAVSANTVSANTVSAAGAPAVRIDLRVLAGLLTAVTALMLAAGTIVTGTGPLAGVEIDSHGHRTTVPRFHFSLESVTQLHADIGWFIGALAVALVVGLRYSGAPRRTVRLGWIVLVGLGLQGIIGYVQYFNHLPAGLVWVHVGLSVLIWIFVLQLYLSTTAGVGAARAVGPTNEDSGADVTGKAGGAKGSMGRRSGRRAVCDDLAIAKNSNPIVFGDG